MTTLPPSIQQYLEGAGFTANEILVLKHLLDGRAMTLRELASKTGKSPGGLDKSVKKLINRGIVKRQRVNESSKYLIDSSDSIRQWMESDTKEKVSLMQRQIDDVKSFINTLENKASGLKVERYEGIKGIRQAYIRMMEEADGQWLQFLPSQEQYQEDSLPADFIEWVNKERRKNDILARVVTIDDIAGRRHREKDNLKHRQTVLVPSEYLEFQYEKIITSKTVATFNYQDQTVNLVSSPEIVETGIQHFKLLFNSFSKGDHPLIGGESEDGQVSFKKRMKHWLGAAALVSVIFLAAMYAYTYQNLKKDLSNNLVSIVATAAPEIAWADVEQLNFARDMKTDAYQRVFTKLNEIRDSNQHMNILYAYVFRRTDVPDMVKFAADADSNYYLPLDPDDEEAIEVVPPGTHYDSDYFYDNHQIVMWEKPEAVSTIVTDQWGTYISATAPIANNEGEALALLGVDMDVTDFFAEFRQRFINFLGSLLFGGLIIVVLMLFVFKVNPLKCIHTIGIGGVRR